MSKLSLHKRATIVALCGDIGSGKTVFTQGVAKAAGITEQVTSPTFIVVKKYEIPESGGVSPDIPPYKYLVHVDAYRIKNSDEIGSLKLEEHLSDPNNLILIEWPERIQGVNLSDIIKVNFKFVNSTTREIEFSE